MTARGTRTGEGAECRDADDLDVEEALALVKEDNGRAPGGHLPAPAAQGAHHNPAAKPDAPHAATPWPQARAVAARAAARPGTGAAPRTPVSGPRDAAHGHTLAAPQTALTDRPSVDTTAMDG